MRNTTLKDWFQELKQLCLKRSGFCPEADLGYDASSFEADFFVGKDAEDVWDELCEDPRVRKNFIEGK